MNYRGQQCAGKTKKEKTYIGFDCLAPPTVFEGDTYYCWRHAPSRLTKEAELRKYIHIRDIKANRFDEVFSALKQSCVLMGKASNVLTATGDWKQAIDIAVKVARVEAELQEAQS